MTSNCYISGVTRLKYHLKDVVVQTHEMVCTHICVSAQYPPIFAIETFEEINKGATSDCGSAPFCLFSFAYRAKRSRLSSRRQYSRRLLVPPDQRNHEWSSLRHRFELRF